MKADVVFDIETVVIPATQADVEKYLREFKPKNGAKKEETILRQQMEAEGNAAGEIEKERRFSLGGKRMISVSLGTCFPETGEVERIEGWVSDDTKSLCLNVKEYLDQFHSFRLIGWNSKSFDFPELVKQFVINKVSPPRSKIGKWDMVDLCNDHSSPFKGRKLKETAQALGLNPPDVRGNDVARLHAEGKFDEILTYNKSDVLITGKIYNYVSGWCLF